MVIFGNSDFTAALSEKGNGDLIATFTETGNKTGLEFGNYKSLLLKIVVQQSSNGDLFFNLLEIPFVGFFRNDTTRYVPYSGKTWNYGVNALFAINYPSKTLIFMSSELNTGYTLNAVYVYGIK